MGEFFAGLDKGLIFAILAVIFVFNRSNMNFLGSGNPGSSFESLPKTQPRKANISYNMPYEEEVALVGSGQNLTAWLERDKVVQNREKQIYCMENFTEKLLSGKLGLSQAEVYTINNFITYGSRGLRRLLPDHRYLMVRKFKGENGRLPKSQDDWREILANDEYIRLLARADKK